MKLHKLIETMRMGKIPPAITFATIEYIEKNGTHTGDQDSKPIFVAQDNENIMYGIKNDNKITSFLTILKVKDAEGYSKLGITFTIPEYRNMKDLQRLFWFVKNDEKIKFISSGTQSADGQNLMKSLARSQRFEMFWLNIKTNEKEKYNEKTDDYPSKHRGPSQTDWRIIIESSSNPVFESRFMGLQRPFHVFDDDTDEIL